MESLRGRKLKNKFWLLYIGVFLLGCTMVFGHVELYKMEETARQQEQVLWELELGLGELRKAKKEFILEQDRWAKEYDMYLPEPEEYQVVYVDPVGTKP